LGGDSESAAGHISVAKGQPSAPAKRFTQKKKAIAVAKVALQVAAAGLKTAPIPNLDQIPNILLMLIQIYEVSHAARNPS
jgi:hypothetical protein